MEISARTPEGQADRCAVCGSAVKREPSDPATGAPCSRCGHLLWFTWEDLGDIDVMKPKENVLTREALDAFLDSVALKPGVHLVLDLVEVHFFASAALARMINLKKRANSVGGRFTIRNVHPALKEVFRTTHLDHVFEIDL